MPALVFGLLVMAVVVVLYGLGIYSTRVWSWEPVDGMCWSRDGMQLAITRRSGYLGVVSLSAFGSMQVTDLLKGNQPPVDEGYRHLEPMNFLRWNHDSTLLAVGSRENVENLQVWQITSRRASFLLREQPMLPYMMGVLGWTTDNRLRLFQRRSFMEYPPAPGSGSPEQIFVKWKERLPWIAEWSQDSSKLFMMSLEDAWIFQPAEPAQADTEWTTSGRLFLLNRYQNAALPKIVRWSPDGTRLAMLFFIDDGDERYLGRPAHIEIWDTITLVKLRTIPVGTGDGSDGIPAGEQLMTNEKSDPRCSPPELAWSRDGKRLACAFFLKPPASDPIPPYVEPKSCAQVWWDPADGRLLASTILRGQGKMRLFRWSPDLDYAAVSERLSFKPIELLRFRGSRGQPIFFTTVRVVASPQMK